MKLDVSKQVIDYAEINTFKMPITSVTGASATATCNATLGKIARSTTTLAAGAEETLTISNSLAAAGDACFATVISSTGGTAGVVSAVTAAGSITVTVSNFHASTQMSAYTVAFLLIKAA